MRKLEANKKHNSIEIILKELKKFSEEDILLIYDQALRSEGRIKNTKRKWNGFDHIENYEKFSEIRNDTIQKLNSIEDPDELNKIFNKVQKIKETSISLNHLYAMKSDERLCHFTFNYIKNTAHSNNINNFYFHNNPYLHINHLIIDLFHKSFFTQFQVVDSSD